MHPTWTTGPRCHRLLGGYKEVVEALLAGGADVNAKNSSDGATALTTASLRGHAGVVQALLANGAGVNAKDREGSTALTLASQYGHPDVVKALFAAKEIEINAKDDHGDSALTLASRYGHLDTHASRYGHLEIVEALLDKGADVNSRANNGATPLMFACMKSYARVVEALLAGAPMSMPRPMTAKPR